MCGHRVRKAFSTTDDNTKRVHETSFGQQDHSKVFLSCLRFMIFDKSANFE